MRSFIMILACLVAFAAANDCDALGKLMVKASWAEAYGSNGKARAALANLLWTDMFRAIPTGPALFPNVQGDDIDSQKFLAHAARVNSAVDLLIEELDSEDTLTAMLNHLQKQHIDRNLPAAGYAQFVTSMTEAVRATVGASNFRRGPWRACLARFTDAISA